MSTEPAPTAALCRYVCMSVCTGRQGGAAPPSGGGGALGAMAEHRLSASSDPSMAARCGYHSRTVFDLREGTSAIYRDDRSPMLYLVCIGNWWKLMLLLFVTFE